jgi:hypothetical protein
MLLVFFVAFEVVEEDSAMLVNEESSEGRLAVLLEDKG